MSVVSNILRKEELGSDCINPTDPTPTDIFTVPLRVNMKT